MSEENVDGYTQIVDAWNDGDIDRLLLFMGERVEVSSFLVGIEGGYRGHEGCAAGGTTSTTCFPTGMGRSRTYVPSTS